MTNPSDPLAIHDLACAARDQGDAAQTEALARQLLAAGHDAPAIRDNLAWALVAQGRLAEARPELERLFVYRAELPAVPATLVRVLHHLGETERATDIALSHLRDHPDDAAVAGALSALYTDESNIEDARKLAERALAADPTQSEALVSLAAADMADGNSAAAEARFAKAAELHPREGRAWLGLGLAALGRLDAKTARPALEKALECFPGHADTLVALAACSALAGDSAGAAKRLEEAARSGADGSEEHALLSAILHSDGAEFRKALRRITPMLSVNRLRASPPR